MLEMSQHVLVVSVIAMRFVSWWCVVSRCKDYPTEDAHNNFIGIRHLEARWAQGWLALGNGIHRRHPVRVRAGQ